MQTERPELVAQKIDDQRYRDGNQLRKRRMHCQQFDKNGHAG
jgi:hypothetical protein